MVLANCIKLLKVVSLKKCIYRKNILYRYRGYRLKLCCIANRFLFTKFNFKLRFTIILFFVGCKQRRQSLGGMGTTASMLK